MNNLVNIILVRSQYLKNVLLHAGIYIICALLFHSCTAYRAERLKNKSYREWKAHQWNKEKQYKENGQTWTSYSRKVEGSNFKEFKIVGEINVPTSTALEIFREKAENSQDYLEMDEGYLEVLSNNEREAVIYSVYNMPFPFKDRAMCKRLIFSVEEKSGIHKISWTEDRNMAPQKKEKVINMSIARGYWEFAPIGKNRSIATYIVHADPGGSIPALMANSAVRKGLPKEFKNIEAIARKLK